MPAAIDELRIHLTDDLGRLAAEHEVPGASVAVLIGDDVVEATCGVTNTRTGEPVTPDTLFMIQSITKVITATLVLQLVDDELVGLDDLVSDHLPGFRTADAEAGAQITVRHLLTHTGGFEGDLCPRRRQETTPCNASSRIWSATLRSTVPRASGSPTATPVSAYSAGWSRSSAD